MNSQPLDRIIQTLVPLNLATSPTPESFRNAFCELGKVDRGTATVGIWQGQTPWEYHHEGDEFLHVLNGEVTLTLLLEGANKEFHLAQNSTFVVPAQVWHRSWAQQPVTLLSVLASPHGPVSFAADPRTEEQLVDEKQFLDDTDT